MAGNEISRKSSPACTEYLEAYERCMEDHVGVRPDPYEGEWCEEFRNAYRVCREGGKPLPGTDKYIARSRMKITKSGNSGVDCGSIGMTVGRKLDLLLLAARAAQMRESGNCLVLGGRRACRGRSFGCATLLKHSRS